MVEQMNIVGAMKIHIPILHDKMMAVQKYHAVLIHEVQKFLCYELEDGGK
jgi:hypothetical protein